MTSGCSLAAGAASPTTPGYVLPCFGLMPDGLAGEELQQWMFTSDGSPVPLKGLEKPREPLGALSAAAASLGKNWFCANLVT